MVEVMASLSGAAPIRSRSEEEDTELANAKSRRTPVTTPEAGFFSVSCDAGDEIIAVVANTSNLPKKVS